MNWTEGCGGRTGKETTEIWVSGAMKEMKCDKRRCGASEGGRKGERGREGGTGDAEDRRKVRCG